MVNGTIAVQYLVWDAGSKREWLPWATLLLPNIEFVTRDGGPKLESCCATSFGDVIKQR